jgi:hypothetical protein
MKDEENDQGGTSLTAGVTVSAVQQGQLSHDGNSKRGAD